MVIAMVAGLQPVYLAPMLLPIFKISPRFGPECCKFCLLVYA